jgi:hypothetical protein
VCVSHAICSEGTSPVPIPRILVEADAIPPVPIKAPVGEACDLGEHVEKTLPDDVPGQELFQEHGE